MNVQHQPEKERFFAPLEGGEAELAYLRSGEVLDLHHTYVPSESRGGGVGAALVRAAFDHARREGLRIRPTCPFVRSWLDDHPEERDLTE